MSKYYNKNTLDLEEPVSGFWASSESCGPPECFWSASTLRYVCGSIIAGSYKYLCLHVH